MRRVAGFLLVTSLLLSASSTAHAASSDVVIGIWPQTFTQFNEIRAASGISIPYFRGRMRDGQFDSNLAPPDDLAAAAAGYSIGMNIQPKTGSGSHRTGILYTDISAQLQAGSGPYYDKLVSFAQEVLALPTYGVVPNYLQFHSEANVQADPGLLDSHPYSGTGPEYQQCYALIHQLFDSLGVTNKIYWQIVLTRAAYAGKDGGPQNWYPTDPNLYDLVGVDAYYQAPGFQSPGWFSPSSAFDDAFAFAQTQGKKVWIDETGADEGGPTHSPTAKAEWFGALAPYLQAHRQSLAGVVFSDSADGGNWFLDSAFAGGRTVPNYTGTTWTGWVRAATAIASPPTPSVSVTIGGSGTGSVTSAPVGIACPGDCAETFDQSQPVALDAVAGPNSVFTGWSGDCAGTVSPCNLTMDAGKNVTATFSLIQRTLSVTVAGTGTGTITSDSGDISCGPMCSANYDHGTVVVLNATPDANVTFAGWSGGGCSGTGDCTVTMDTAVDVTATFSLVRHALNVTTTGTGTGSVTSDVGEIDCGQTCSASYDHGTAVVLSATPDADVTFAGWSGGGCSGTGDCMVTMDAARSVNAEFDVAAHLLIVTTQGSGTGRVTSDVGGIDCPGVCGATYEDGVAVGLTATGDPNSTFTGWNGACRGTAICDVSMDGAQSVTATFGLIQHPLSITTTGSGSGTVTSDSGAINCGTTCSASYDHGTSVVLSAAPGANVTFAGWSGAGCSGTAGCTVTMDAARTVNARFDLAQHLLSLTKTGAGTGTITSDAGGINCGPTCSATFDHGTAVLLHAAPGANSVFTGWSGGGCAGASDCSVSMAAAMSVDAHFDLAQRLLTATKAGNGNGTLTSDVGGVNCPGTCAASYTFGSAVVLTANLGANSVFAGWSGGACSGATTTCDLTMDSAKNVTATFVLIQHTLNVTKAGTGTGQITSGAGGINCPGTCSANYDHGSLVVLTATPTGGATFAGWSGGGCSGTGPCDVTMNAATTVTGTFNPPVTASTIKDSDPTVSYNGWSGVADVAANGGFYRTSGVKNDTVTWISPAATAITWVTRTGPAQGKASVTIDGKNKGTFDLYASAQAPRNEIFSGLANKAHTVVIKTLFTKNAASSNYNVRLDAFVAGGVTAQESDPSVQYDTWKSASQALATDGTYRSSATATATVIVSFTGSAIDWVTTKGKAYGKASVAIDGVNKGTVDLYQSATAWQSHVSYTGLSAGTHTMVIRVLGQKDANATGKTVVVDGFIVHA